MKAKLLFVAPIVVALLASGAAMAQDRTAATTPQAAAQAAPQASVLSRADVRAELLRAQAAGELTSVGESYNQLHTLTASVRQRDENRAEARNTERAAKPVAAVSQKGG